MPDVTELTDEERADLVNARACQDDENAGPGDDDYAKGVDE